jgi:hypothetical protein
MSGARIGLVFGIGFGASLAGWVVLRRSIRDEVERVLNEEYAYDQTIQGNQLTQWLGSSLDLPTAKELAASVTPTWSLILPEAAINDILERGRDSQYWPALRRQSRLSPDVDKFIFGMLRSVRDYYAAPPAQRQSQIS